jgi:hypothetical protein
VLKRAAASLPKINTVQMEMSLVPLHCNELLFYEMCILMREKGYKLIAIEMDSLPRPPGKCCGLNAFSGGDDFGAESRTSHNHG